MAHVGKTAAHSLIGVVLPVRGPEDSRRRNWAINASGRTRASCVTRRQLSRSCRSSSSGSKIFTKSNSFLGVASLPRAVHGSALSLSNGSRTVCLFGRRRKSAPYTEQEPVGASQRMEVRERTVPVDWRERTVPGDWRERTVPLADLERTVPAADQERTVPVAGQAVQYPIESTAKNSTASAFIVAIVCAGVVLLAMKVVTFLRGGYLRKELAKRRQAAFAGPEEEAEALVQARARLAQAFGVKSGEGTAHYRGKITRMQVVSMMDSAADYLYALATEVAETKGELDDKEERLALALKKSKQDAAERKELIRRISMAEAEVVEGQLKQAADKAAAASREKNLKEEMATEMDRLVTEHRAMLEHLQSQMKEKEREEAMAAAAMKKLTEEVKALKQGLKEKEAKLAAATRKAEEESELNSTLSAHFESTSSELEAALSREADLKASLEETESGVEGAELRLEQMQRRHEGEIRAVRGIALAQAKGLEERLRGAQEKAEEVRALKDAETAAREEAEARADELQGQVEQLEQDLIFLEAKNKENAAKAARKPAEESKRAAEIARLKEALESKTHQADVAKELVLQFMENEREKDFELKQLKREAAYAKERLGELERNLEVGAASRIEGALRGSKGGGSVDKSALERARFEQQMEGFRQDSEQEIATLRSDLKSARDQLTRVQKQHGMEMEAKLGKQEREFRLQISERESERDGCLVKLGSLEEELALEVQAREQARRELSTAQEQLLEWERRAIEMEASHAAALEAERETSRQKLEALFLDFEEARDKALEKESERVALLQRTEQLQAALAEAKSTWKLQEAKVSEAETAIALHQDIVEEATAKQDRYQAEIEDMANEHATLVRSLEEARAAEAAVAEKERNRLENEVALLWEQVQAMETAVNNAETAKLQAFAQFAELETTHAEATQRLAQMSELQKELSLRKQDEILQRELHARIAELDDLTRSKDDVIKELKEEKEALATSKDEVIRTLEGEKEALVMSKDDVIKALEVEKEALAKSKVDTVGALEAEKEALANSKDDVIRALEGEKEAAVFEALERLEEADALRGRVRALLEEQDRALETFRAEAAAGDEELARVRQRLMEVEQALLGSQEELRTTKMEEDRLLLELAAAKASSVDLATQQESSKQQVDGLERALQESHTEAEQLAKREQDLGKGLWEEAQRREQALRELQERDEVIVFFQRYFEERSLLDVQLYDLGRAHSRLEVAKQQLAASTSVHGSREDITSFEADFSSLLHKFEAAVEAAAATYDERAPGSNGMSNGLLEKKLARRAVKENGLANGLPAPRALELVGVDEVAGTSLADLDGRLFTAEQKAEQLQVEIRQRVVRQMEWQEDKDSESAEQSKGGNDGNSKRGKGKDGQKESQQLEVQERVSEMMKTLSERLSGGEK